MPAVSVAAERIDQPDVTRLLRAADRRSERLYGVKRRPGASAGLLLSSGAVLFVARVDGHAVGCGGYLLLDDGQAEVTRLFVLARSRGLGVGRRLMGAIEAGAAQAGVRRMKLETGIQSIAAIALYERLGYAVCAPFGRHLDDPLSRFMERPL